MRRVQFRVARGRARSKHCSALPPARTERAGPMSGALMFFLCAPFSLIGELMDARKRQRCSVCGCASPPVNTNYTLISGSRGWRTLITTDASGRREASYFCPSCWTKRKESARSA